MNQKEFAECIGKTYQVALETGDSVELVLTETGDLPPPPKDSAPNIRQDPFYLVFHGPGHTPLETGALNVSGPNSSKYFLAFNVEGYIDDDAAKGLQYCVIIN